MFDAIKISDYDYHLPGKKIAGYPLSDRAGSKLLVYNKGKITHKLFRELPGLLDQDILMIYNNTRVVQSRLKFAKSTGSKIEIFCLEPYDPPDYALAFQKKSDTIWKCLVGNAKKWKAGILEKDLVIGGKTIRLQAEKAGRDKDAFLIRFNWEPGDLDFGTILENAGSTPIPPYLNREAIPKDKNTYQTVYSRYAGSVAAPTAGLHFTGKLLEEISARGTRKLEITLHVGAGTFQPVISENINGHPMHAEHFFIDRTAIESILDHTGKILAIGTTTTRVLESLYWLGLKIGDIDTGSRSPIFLDQWDAYNFRPGDKKRSLEHLLEYMFRNSLESLEGLTRLMIVPGYTYRMVDRLLTNYHQPKSTLLLLVAAFIGNDWLKVYQYALDNEFRFLSYGDSSLLIP